MATKQSKAAKTRAANAQKKALREAAAIQLRAILTFAVGLLIFALAVVPGSNVWLWFHNLLLGIFSWSAFLVGPLIIFIAILTSLDREDLPAGPRIWQSAVLVVLVSAALQILHKGQPIGNLPETIKALYLSGQALQGGGVLSLLLGWPLLKLFDFTGAVISIVLLIFVFVMILTGGTVIGFMRGATRPVRKLGEAYTEHRENADRTASTTPRFDINVPMDDSALPAEAITPDRGSSLQSAKDRLLDAAGIMASPAAKAVKEDPAALPEPPVSDLDDIVTRAVSGEAVISESDFTPLPGAKIAFEVKGDTLRKNGDEEFIVPPVDDNGEDFTAESFDLPEEEPGGEAEPFVPLEGEQRPLYSFPPINLLRENKTVNNPDISEELRSNAERLVDTLKSFGVQTRVLDISRGPAVTRYELQPSAGVKISKITGLADDIALNLAAAGVRIEAPIPNKSAVGIEVPNKVVSAVTIREVIDSPAFENAESKLTVAMGKDIAGNLTVADLSRMPHLLIAGATGSGKSVCINSIIISLLYKASPDEVKLIMIDPKVVELGSYNGIPHLLVPVVTDPRKAAGALCWAVGEMMNRYKLFSDNNARDISGYNRLAATSDTLNPLPHIVIIIDELSDLMMVCPNEVEDYICRLAQMARAAGMHLVIATQRPSVDVITGIIKANIPSRIAFAVSSQVDSRTILDLGGAEKLLGRGDMLFYPVGSPKPTRVQGCFVTDKEVERVVSFVKEGEKSEYDTQIIEEIDRQAAAGKKGGGGGGTSDEDEVLVQSAIEVVVEAGLASTSLLQRRLKLGYARAARIVDELEARGIVGPFEGSKPRQVLISKERWYEMKLSQDS